MRRSNLKIAVSMLAVFLSGIAVGGVGYRLYTVKTKKNSILSRSTLPTHGTKPSRATTIYSAIDGNPSIVSPHDSRRFYCKCGYAATTVSLAA